jgi:HAD superfamily PSPase-like hydrolase
MQPLLICFDVDGTLIDDTTFIWETLHDCFQTDPVVRKFWSDAYWQGKISYAEWATKDVELWMEKDINRTRMMEMISNLKPMEGALDTLDNLKEKSHILGIISGSLDIALESTIGDCDHYFDYVFLNRLTFDSEGKLQGITPTPYDIEHKATGLMALVEETGIPIERTVYIGDNFNDVEVAKMAGFSIAFNCKSDDLAKVADRVVPGTDLRVILPLIDAYSSELDTD